MRILVPVDETDRYRLVLNFLVGLELPDVTLKLLHAVPPLVSYDTSLMAMAAINATELCESEEQEAKQKLATACAEATSKGFTVHSEVAFGYPCSEIEKAALDFKADLVAVATNPKGPLEKFVSGNVAINLAASHRGSLLVVRTSNCTPENLTMIFATDHSRVSEDGLEQLLRWQMKGITKAEVLNAYRFVGHEAVMSGRNQVFGRSDIDEAARQLVMRKTQAVADRISQNGIPARANCFEGTLTEGMHGLIAANSGALVVLASEGHDFWQNLTGASTTFNEVAKEPCSVLILRPDRSVSAPVPTGSLQTAKA